MPEPRGTLEQAEPRDVRDRNSQRQTERDRAPERGETGRGGGEREEAVKTFDEGCAQRSGCLNTGPAGPDASERERSAFRMESARLGYSE